MDYRYIGCFKDFKKPNRALPVLLGNYLAYDHSSIEKCAKASLRRGYKLFGVQDYGRECWSGMNASLTYDRYGASNGCSNGIGGAWANDIYTLICKFFAISWKQAERTSVKFAWSRFSILEYGCIYMITHHSLITCPNPVELIYSTD